MDPYPFPIERVSETLSYHPNRPCLFSLPHEMSFRCEMFGRETGLLEGACGRGVRRPSYRKFPKALFASEKFPFHRERAIQSVFCWSRGDYTIWGGAQSDLEGTLSTVAVGF